MCNECYCATTTGSATTAKDNLWDNYYINTACAHSGGTIKDNCYRPRLSAPNYSEDSENNPKRWVGIDCSGFLQRCAYFHSQLPDLGSRVVWSDNWATQMNSQVNCKMLVFGTWDPPYGSSDEEDNQYTDYLGKVTVTDNEVCNKLVPGDIIIKIDAGGGADHVAIVNYVTGVRGSRGMDNIYLIQAIGGNDGEILQPDNRLQGMVTDTWRWDRMTPSDNYSVRRLKP